MPSKSKEKPVIVKLLPKAVQAGGQLYRLAQAQTLLDAVNGLHEPEHSSDGKIIPTGEAVEQVNREHPELFKVFNEEG